MSKAAESQHYVPKFILRKFLSNKDKEQVTVYQKSTGRVFSPSIGGIMSERRFNEFRIDEDYYASFEGAVCRIEDVVLPVYKELVKTKELTEKQEQKSILGIFFAF